MTDCQHIPFFSVYIHGNGSINVISQLGQDDHSPTCHQQPIKQRPGFSLFASKARIRYQGSSVVLCSGHSGAGRVSLEVLSPPPSARTVQTLLINLSTTRRENNGPIIGHSCISPTNKIK